MSLRTRFIAVAGLVCTIAVSSALAGPSHLATKPGKNGLIAFKRYSDAQRSTGAVYTIAQRPLVGCGASPVPSKPCFQPQPV